MHIGYLYWKNHLLEKILEKHGVIPEEIEEVIEDDKCEVRKSGKHRYLIFGQSYSGRYLLVVLDEESKGVFVPLTARDMTESEKRTFKRRRG